VHQTFVPGRAGRPLDVLIDVVGIALGVLAWERLVRRRSA
jgi:VanZ family protein